MKKIILLTLLSCSVFAQNRFQEKYKAKGGNTANAQEFKEIDGSKNSSNVRVGSLRIEKYRISKDETGNIIAIENPFGLKSSNFNARKTKETLCFDFLNEVKTHLEIKNPSEEFKIQEIKIDDINPNNTHLRLQQTFKGLPVYGSELMLHTADNEVELMNGRSYPTPTLSNVNPKIIAQKAIDIALQDVGKKSIIQQGAWAKLLQNKTAETELVIYHLGDKTAKEHLTWVLTIRPNVLERWVYFIDAQTGEVLDKFNHTCSLDGVVKATARDLNGITQTLNTYQHQGKYLMMDLSRAMYNATASKLPDDPIGAIWTIDAQNTGGENLNFAQISSNTNTDWKAVAVSAHSNAGLAYEYFLKNHKRNSLNGKGGSIISVVNVAEDDGKGMDNAYWNGEFMAYGNGASAFKPLAGALDVAGHEMTHGVVENTAKLEYRNQSGAINESMADVFGALIDADDWTLGEDVVKTSVFPSGALRSLSNPNQGGKQDNGYQPKTMGQYAYLADTPDEDNGGVHVNSGIPNHAFYLFASNSSVGRDKAGQVYYRALTNYLTRTSKFVDLRLAIVRAANELYGESIANIARAAFDAVGVADPNPNSGGGTTTPPTTTPPVRTDIPVNTGTDNLLVYSPSDKSLYTGLASVGPEKFTKISASGARSKPSITDDGKFAYFVGEDKNIRRINLTGTVSEATLSQDASWDNVAISKDGKRLAALKATEDKYIYVFDLENNGTGAKFKLYNPTYTQGVSTGEVLYADSFEWDFTGEKLVYDAYNQFKSPTGKALDYWDVGFIKVWDTTAKTFAKGTVEKLFTDLAEGESIGNPTFSKNSPDILAFDYLDGDINYLIGVDVEQNDVISIYKNNAIGYPDYARLDDKMIFNTLSNNVESVAVIGIKADKISPNGNSQILFTDAKWAVWFAQGTRVIPGKKEQTISFSAITDKSVGEIFNLTASSSANFAVSFVVVSGDATIAGNKITLGKSPGKVKIKAVVEGNKDYNAASAEQSFCINPPTPILAFNGQEMSVSGGTNYIWYANGQQLDAPQTTTKIPTSALAIWGTFTAKTTTTDGCLSAASNSVQILALANETTLQEAIKTYPNPTADMIYVDTPADFGLKKIVLVSADGKILAEPKIQANTSEISLKTLNQGVYFLQLEGEKEKISKKVIKQ